MEFQRLLICQRLLTTRERPVFNSIKIAFNCNDNDNDNNDDTNDKVLKTYISGLPAWLDNHKHFQL